MIYPLICAAAFYSLSKLKRDAGAWRILAAVAVGEWLSLSALGGHEVVVHFAVSAVAFAGALALCSRRSLLGYYQASILAMTLCSYWLVEYDAWNGTNIIYDNYETVIYGLVGCQFVGSFPTLWAAYRDIASGRGSWVADILRGEA